MSDELRHITPDRRHSLSGKKNLDWFFANRKWVRTAGNSVVEAAWAVRALPEGEAALRFLFLAAKRSHKRAHDRNQIKRWLRAAILELKEFAEIENVMMVRCQQVIVMMRVSKPVDEVAFDVILSEVHMVAVHLKNRTANDGASTKSRPLQLVRKKDKEPLP